MAYPSVDAAYGFKPINELNGLPYAGAIRQIPIARNYGTAIFNGDLVEFIANGMITLTSCTTRTSFNPKFKIQHSQFKTALPRTALLNMPF